MSIHVFTKQIMIRACYVSVMMDLCSLQVRQDLRSHEAALQREETNYKSTKIKVNQQMDMTIAGP